ncbi:MAG TPA: flagellar hook-associated protein FlgL [Terriglobia bacterium]|nr:flagellar hook-associated protein FlgL [Terriglobia bacterium]
MRLTPSTQNRNFLQNINDLQNRLNKAQDEVSSGKTVTRLSDNPFAAAQASKLMSVIGANDQFIALNEQLLGRLEVTDSALQGMTRSVDSARVLAAQALSGTTTPEARLALAQNVDGVKAQILSASNTQVNGVFLFGGTQSNTQPFVDAGGTITYNGNDEAIHQRLDRSVVIQTNITGQDLFMGSPSVFTTLDDLKAAILANDAGAIRARLGDLDAVSDRINAANAVVGNNLQLVQQLQRALPENNEALQRHISSLTDANLVESISDMNLTNQAIQVSLNSQSQIQHLSLLDFLR